VKAGPNAPTADGTVAPETPIEPRASFEGRAMGSALRLTIGSDRDIPSGGASRVWDIVVASFEASEAAMSRFRDSSELTGLNRLAGSGRWSRPSWRLRRALAGADRANRLSGGRFDPRIVADLDRLGYRGAPIAPTGWRGRDERATRQPDERVVDRRGRLEVRLARPVDLGGIGKGLALRWATAELVRAGLTDFLLEAGGDLVAYGLDPALAPWLVGIEDPTGTSEHVAVIGGGDGAVATSSLAVHRWTLGGRVVHHLLDPTTGEPAVGGLLAVTVAAADPAWAEVWSKVLFLSGRATIGDEARARGLAAWWIADDGSVSMTPAARSRTVWLAAEAA